MTITDADAFEAMLAHHRTLEDQVARRVATLQAIAVSNAPYEAAVAELVAYVAEEVLPHAMAEEHSIYQAATGLPDLSGTVAEMIAEHRQLAASVAALATSQSPSDAAHLADAIGTLFTDHVAKENDLLLPPLQADDTVSLSQLLVQMHRLTEAARNEASAIDDVSLPATATSVGEEILDVRELAPAKRHESIFAAYDALPGDAGFVLVNDHDPKPLRYQFEAEHTGEYTWDYLEQGPRVWRVRIGRLVDAHA